MKLVPLKNFIKKVRKMSNKKLIRQLYTTGRSPSLRDYKLVLEEELIKRGIETSITEKGGIYEQSGESVERL